MSVGLKLALSALLLILVVAVSGASRVSHAAYPGTNGKIAFIRNVSGDIYSPNFDVFTMNAGGSDLTQLTFTSDNEFSPAWSPDGSKIVYQCGSQTDICVMNGDGSGQAQLTNTPFADGYPTWSPDGTKIAFFSNRDTAGGPRATST